ncbi:RNA recognition motif domain containing protein [Acanthamoeba castellanii str. Neff]|uniref:RNA recognition motif domain containing protein n=1 Tax=Acanthamoeba castellanii (strain ATCC 30010 / Neff) TaxID=1257118 RepID=L8GN98_ACACF|nr:RNA recognition motif domain containing protein [Acanthamoeba castellanii str. Neff]ELR14540.1 RNA recognition motif domain containing protein [Acanthamoeba castellanii str. Neff]
MEGQDALQAELQHKEREVEQKERAAAPAVPEQVEILAEGEEEEGGEVAGQGLADEAEEEALNSGKPVKPRKLSNLERKLQARAARQAPRGRPAPSATGEPAEPTDPSLMSSIVMVPPIEAWPALQAIRRIHDTGFVRWLPHVNMIYPFVPNQQFPEAAQKLREALASFPAFRVRLRELSFFKHHRSWTVWLKPETEREVEEKMVEWQKEWKEIEFDVTEIYLISRLGANDTPFDIRYAIPLQQASSTAEPETTTAVRLPPPSFVPHPIECDERAEVESKTRVIVFNIPFDVTEDDLIELFRGIGERLNIAIDDVKLIRKPKQSARAKKSSTGRAFVELRTAADQTTLLENVGEIVLGDRTLALRPAQA